MVHSMCNVQLTVDSQVRNDEDGGSLCDLILVINFNHLYMNDGYRITLHPPYSIYLLGQIVFNGIILVFSGPYFSEISDFLYQNHAQIKFQIIFSVKT